MPLEQLDQHQRADVEERGVSDDPIKSSSPNAASEVQLKFSKFIRKVDLDA